MVITFYIGLSWIKGIADDCGFSTLTNKEDPKYVLTAKSAITLALEIQENRWKLLADGTLQHKENVWKSSSKWKVMNQIGVKIENIESNTFLSTLKGKDKVTTESESDLIWIKNYVEDKKYFTLTKYSTKKKMHLHLTAKSNTKLEIDKFIGK